MSENNPNKCSAIFCNHANEMPVECTCPETCYCYVEGGCGKRRARLNKQAEENGIRSLEYRPPVKQQASKTSVSMTRDDVMRETINHVRRVATLLSEIAVDLIRRANIHDDSKFSPEEFESFAQETPNLRALTYDSDEYKAALGRIQPALQFHYSRNDHHPEHFPNGIHDMDLLQLIEMLADWKAATERHANGSLSKSIISNAKRFGYDNKMKHLLAMTALNIGWITTPEYMVISEDINNPPSGEPKKCGCDGRRCRNSD